MNGQRGKTVCIALRPIAPWLLAVVALVVAAMLFNEYQERRQINGGNVSSFNYTSHYIAESRIFSEGNPYSAGGPNVMPKEADEARSGGGKFMCCIGIPARWREGMKVIVKWRRDTRPYDEDRSGVQWLTATTVVPPYSPGTYGFIIHYLPDDRIRIQVRDKHGILPRVDDSDPYVVQGVLDPELNTTTHSEEHP